MDARTKADVDERDKLMDRAVREEADRSGVGYDIAYNRVMHTLQRARFAAQAKPTASTTTTKPATPFPAKRNATAWDTLRATPGRKPFGTNGGGCAA